MGSRCCYFAGIDAAQIIMPVRPLPHIFDRLSEWIDGNAAEHLPRIVFFFFFFLFFLSI